MTSIFRPVVLVVALLISARPLWLAFVDHAMPVTNALIWFLVAVPVSGVALAGLGSLMSAHRRANLARQRQAGSHDDRIV